MPEKLPILSVKSDNRDFFRPAASGGTTIFDEKDLPATRIKLVAQRDQVKAAFADVFASNPSIPAVAKVRLKEEAFAKSHRPNNLLVQSDCPIITVNKFGELLTSVTPASISKLKQAVISDDRKSMMANISSIAKIEPFTAEDAVPMGMATLELLIKEGVDELKFKLFQHTDVFLERVLLQAFFEKAKAQN